MTGQICSLNQSNYRRYMIIYKTKDGYRFYIGERDEAGKSITLTAKQAKLAAEAINKYFDKKKAWMDDQCDVPPGVHT